jgi:pimeloyl-ACP methyl ester carboxylesterase
MAALPAFRASALPGATRLESRVLEVEGSRLARRVRLLLPEQRKSTEPIPLLVLLHGLGETGNEQAGVNAWSERYGLVSAYERLLRPPIVRTLAKARYLTDEQLESLNASLRERPFSGMAIACPVTPNVYRQPSTSRALDEYADWIGSKVLPAVKDAAGIGARAPATSIDGCSLGGFVALEIYLRRPDLFGGMGMVQGAIGAGSAAAYAARIRRAADDYGSPSVRFGTSTLDPYLKANRALSDELSKREVPHTLAISPGPHDQPWLREAGALTMLHWHDMRFAERRVSNSR